MLILSKQKKWPTELVHARNHPPIHIPFNPALSQHKKHPKAVPITEVFKKAEKYGKMHEKGIISNQAEPARNDTNLLTTLLFPLVISKFDY